MQAPLAPRTNKQVSQSLKMNQRVDTSYIGKQFKGFRDLLIQENKQMLQDNDYPRMSSACPSTDDPTSSHPS